MGRQTAWIRAVALPCILVEGGAVVEEAVDRGIGRMVAVAVASVEACLDRVVDYISQVAACKHTR